MCAHDDSTAVSTAPNTQDPAARGATCPSCGGTGRLLATNDLCGACRGSGDVSLATAHEYMAGDLSSIRAMLTAARMPGADADALLSGADRLVTVTAVLTGQALAGPSPDNDGAAGSVLRESIRSIDGGLPALAAAIISAFEDGQPAVAAAEMIARSLTGTAMAAEDEAAKLR